MPLNFANRDRQTILFDDFYKLDTAQWAAVNDGGTGTNTLNGTHGGWMSVVTAGADNDYHTLTTTAKSFQFLTDKNLSLEARFTASEANTNQTSIVIGFMDTTTTGGLQSGTSGPLASFDGAIFYKIEGTQTLRFMVSNGSSQTVSAITWAWTAGTTYTVRLEYNQNDGTTGIITPFVNDVPGTPIPVAISTMAAMFALFGVKAGSSSAESLTMDYILVYGDR